jgi:beta-glucanase (GH16 family)
MDSQGLKTNPKDDWHDYELHWTPDYVRWFYDGIMVRST